MLYPYKYNLFLSSAIIFECHSERSVVSYIQIIVRSEFCIIFALCNFRLQMNRFLISAVLTLMAFLSGARALAQDTSYDVFNPIAKYIAMGDADKLSAWFSDNLEVSIFSNSSDSSCNQARQIIKSFFKSYTPRSFEINHKAGRSNMKYALGTLNAGGELFTVTIFVSYKDSDYRIQHLKIERID